MSILLNQALIPTDTGYTSVRLQFEGQHITAIDSELPTPDNATVIECQNQLVLPGCVNAHTHSNGIWQRGTLPLLPLELWLQQLAPPLSLEQVYLSAQVTAIEILLSGGTTVVDHLPVIPGQELDTLAAADRAYREIGIRAFLAPLLADQGGADPRAGDTQELLAFLATAVQQFHRPEEGIHIMVAPTGLHACTRELWEGCLDLSQTHTLCRHTHLLETKHQQHYAQETFGCSAVEYLDQLGYLGATTSLAHCIWLTDSDIDRLARSGSTVVHNPISNLRLGAGIAPILKYLANDINVAIGTDGSASNDSQDLLHAIKLACILHTVREPDYQYWPTARQALHLATVGGAKGIDLADKLGSLTPGSYADAVLYDHTCFAMMPMTDPIGLVILGRPTQAISDVWVSGRHVVAGGEILGADVAALKQAIKTALT